MSGFDALLPNQKSRNSRVDIGESKFCPDSGFQRTDAHGLWLGSGTLALASSFPQAAKYDFLHAVGKKFSLPQTVTITDYATKPGTGIVVAATGSTALLVSLDYGKTWASVSGNAGGNIVSVCYSAALDLFIAAGNTGSTFWVATQTPAAIASGWSTRTGTAITSGNSDSAWVRASATEVIMVCAGTGAGSVSRSTNGASWAGVNTPSAINTFPKLAYGGGVWVMIGNTTTGNRSTDGGATWSSNSGALCPAACDIEYINGSFFAYKDSTLYASENGAANTWSSSTSAFGAKAVVSSFNDGTKIVALLRDVASSKVDTVGYSTDGVNFKYKSMSFSGSYAANSPRVMSDGVNVVAQPGSSSGTVIYQDSLSAPTYIGYSTPITTSGGGGSAARLYTKVRD
jgi:hypothetical protein